jgi:hypothetical protein
VFDFQQLLEATNYFSDENKLGEGGFGAVYKVKQYVFLISIYKVDCRPGRG